MLFFSVIVSANEAIPSQGGLACLTQYLCRRGELLGEKRKREDAKGVKVTKGEYLLRVLPILRVFAFQNVFYASLVAVYNDL